MLKLVDREGAKVCVRSKQVYIEWLEATVLLLSTYWREKRTSMYVRFL